MIKKKLLAVVGGSMSVVVATATALTLALSGPRQTQSLHSLSDNEAVSQGITNLFSSASSGVDTMKGVIDTIEADKASLSIGFNINELEDSPELNGMGGNIILNCDAENKEYSIDLSAAYGSVELINALLYIDKAELRASIPAILDGTLVIPYNNLEEDLANSYFGSLLAAEGFDYDDYKAELEEFMAVLEETTASMPATDFDYEEFADGVLDVMESAYQDAVDAMSVTDNGKQALKGGNYQCYTATISVKDLSYIVKDAIIYMLNDEDFLAYIEEVYSYMDSYESYDYDDYYEDDYSDLMSDYELDIKTQMQSAAKMIDSYWNMVVTELEAILGKNIEFTIYLTDTVETAGFEFYISYNEDGTLNYSKSAALAADEYVAFKGDFTGGAEIGDYTNIDFEILNSYIVVSKLNYSFKSETNGDFDLNISGSEGDNTIFLIHADGSYTENGPFFKLVVDSFKAVDETGTTLFDVGFNLAFEEIDGVEKPITSPEYNVWEMDEDDLTDLIEEINDKIGDLEALMY